MAGFRAPGGAQLRRCTFGTHCIAGAVVCTGMTSIGLARWPQTLADNVMVTIPANSVTDSFGLHDIPSILMLGSGLFLQARTCPYIHAASSCGLGWLIA
jgi:hypothetical protein